MSSGSTSHWKRLEARSGTLFLISGVIVTVYATAHGIEAATSMVLEPNPFEFGYVIGFLGLLGLYPSLAEERPWLARSGAGAAVLGIVGLSAFTMLHLAELGGLVEAGGPAWFIVFVPLPLIGFVIGYLSIGFAVLRGRDRSRTLGVLLLVPGLIVVGMIISMLTGYSNQQTAFVVSAGEAMAHLAIGATLRTRSSASTRAGSSPEGQREPVVHD